MIRRRHYLEAIRRVLAHNPVCALAGTASMRQKRRRACRSPSSAKAITSDLETATGMAQLANAELTLTPLSGLVVIDEIQRRPGAFYLAKTARGSCPVTHASFLILGSAAPELAVRRVRIPGRARRLREFGRLLTQRK